MNVTNVMNQNEWGTNENAKQEIVSITDLLTPGGPRENGFYVASGQRDLVPFVMGRVVDFMGHESRLCSMQKGKVAPSSQAEIGKLIWIDSGNSFDSYAMGRMAAQRGLNPMRVLRAVQVARPFTAFQFQQMLDRVPPSTHRGSHQGAASPSLVQRLPLVIISDLMKLFADSEIQEGDARRAFRDLLMRLSFLKKRAIVLGLMVHHPVPPERQHFLSQIWDLADRVLVPRRLSHSSSIPSYENAATPLAV